MKKIAIPLLIILVCLPAFLALLHPGFFVTDDGEWMIIRLTSFYQALADGQFPVRFLHRLNFDYGYPVATFLYPGFLYAGVLLHILKFSFVESIKIILGISLFGSALFTYLWLANVFKNKFPSIIGAIIALYFPYHLYDVYVRGSVGEVFALMWVPFIFWMIEKRSMFFTSIGIFLLVISHNTLAALFLPLILFYLSIKIIFSKKKKAYLLHSLVTVLVGISMAAFFWLPIIVELPITQFSRVSVSNPLEYFASLSLISFLGLFIIVVSIILFFKQKLWHSKKEINILFFLFFAVGLVSILFSSSLSSPLWSIIPSSLIQFPFRLLSIEIIAIPFLAAFIFTHTNGMSRNGYLIVTILLLAIATYPYITPKEFIDRGEGFYITNDATTTVKDEYQPRGASNKPTERPAKKVEVIKGEGVIEEVMYDNKTIQFTANNKKDSTVQINTLYWPGWKASLNGQSIHISSDNPKGVMTIEIPSGEQQVVLQFIETQTRLVADIVSIISFVILIVFVRFQKRLFPI